MKYYFKKHRIKIFFLLVLSLIVFGCSFLIKEVNVKQENERTRPERWLPILRLVKLQLLRLVEK